MVLPQILLRKLVLVGTRKNYEVSFRKGLNIVYGDSDTGKSSILNLIDYSLGAKAVYSYPELQEVGKYVLLELKLNGKVYTIRRDINDSGKDIEVYSASIGDIDDVFPKVYYAHSNKKGELEYFSEFLLENLGVSNVKIKKAPTKENSEMSRLSFRDIFKYCYLNQDSVGSKSILDSNNWSVGTKNQEVFKYLFNLLDSNISQIQKELSDARVQRDKVIEEYKMISSFLRNAQLEGYETLLNTRNQIDNDIYHVQQEISNLNLKMISESGDHDQLRQDIAEHDSLLQDSISQYEVNELHIKNNIILKKEYLVDVQKIEASLEVAQKVVESTQHTFSCPLCSTSVSVNDIKTDFENYDKVSLERELRSVKKRMKEVDTLVQNIREENEEIQEDIIGYKGVLKKLRNQLDNESKEFVSPFLTQMEKLITDKATLQESRKALDYRIKVRVSLAELDSKNIVLDNRVTFLREQLALLEDKAPTVDIVLSDLGNDLADFLNSVKIKNPTGISIDGKSFLPIVRNTPYEKITSGGVRTLVSVGYFISLLTYSLGHASNHPKLVLIDTVGKYLGKTSHKYQDTDKESDVSEGITQTDASKYTEMYKQFVLLSKLHNDFQLIVVDNDLPSALELELKEYVIKHFSESGEDGSVKGFIDDAV